jgi:hypothetical protein
MSLDDNVALTAQNETGRSAIRNMFGFSGPCKQLVGLILDLSTVGF